MSGIKRVTPPLLDVLACFLAAFEADAEVHGWAIMQATKRAGPTVYGVLDRLEDAGWITSRWDDDPAVSGPRRRLYALTPNGRVEAVRLLAERRPAPAPGARKPGPVMVRLRGTARRPKRSRSGP